MSIINVLASSSGNFLNDIIDGLQKALTTMMDQWYLVVVQLAATILIFLIIRFFLWKKITVFVDKKQEAVNQQLFEAHNENKRIQQLKSETLKEYEAVKSESRELKDMLSQEAHAERDRIVEEARLEANRRLDQVEYDVQQQIKDSNEKIKESIKTIAFIAAEKILQREVDEEVHADILESIIKEELE